MTRSKESAVPDPWAVLANDFPDVVLLRLPIEEPGRYYDDQRAIVLRESLTIEAERRYLWHELVHARRRDSRWEGWLRDRREQSVEREAARWAMPQGAIVAAMERSATWHDLVWHLKVPESWVLFRLERLHPAERTMLERVCRCAEGENA